MSNDRVRFVADEERGFRFPIDRIDTDGTRHSIGLSFKTATIARSVAAQIQVAYELGYANGRDDEAAGVATEDVPVPQRA
jgi:hypothetical protein